MDRLGRRRGGGPLLPKRALTLAQELLTHAGLVFAVSAGNEDTDAATRRPASYDDTSMAISATGQVVDENGAVIGDGWPSWSDWGDDPGHLNRSTQHRR